MIHLFTVSKLLILGTVITSFILNSSKVSSLIQPPSLNRKHYYACYHQFPTVTDCKTRRGSLLEAMRGNTKFKQAIDSEEVTSENLRRYKNRSNILQHEVGTKAKIISTQNAKLILLQDVVMKMKKSNRDSMNKITLLKKQLESSQRIILDEKKSQKENNVEKENLMEEKQMQLEKSSKYIKDLQQQLRAEGEKRISIGDKYEFLKVVFEKMSKENKIEIRKYEDECKRNREMIQEMEDQILNQNLEVERLLEARNETDVKERLEKMKLEEECNRLNKKMKNLESNYSLSEVHVRDVNELYHKLKNEMGQLLKKEILKSSSIEAEIERLQNQRTDMEVLLNDTNMELEALRLKVSNETQLEPKYQDDTISKEAIQIATAAVQQSEEREEQLNNQIEELKTQLTIITNEKDDLRSGMEGMRIRYYDKREETELKNQQQIQNLANSLEGIIANYTRLQVENEQTKHTMNEKRESEKLLWKEKFSRMEDEQKSIIKCLEQEIVFLKEAEEENKKNIEAHRSESRSDYELSDIMDSGSSQVVVKRQRLRALWTRIKSPGRWFGKGNIPSKEGVEG